MRIQIRDLAPATVYGLQFRSTNGSAFSEWSPIYNVTTTSDSIAPATPTNVTWTVEGRAFLATWDAVVVNSDGTPANDFSHYVVVLENATKQVTYKTTALRFDFTYEMNYAAFDKVPSATVKLQVGAVDTTGNVSVLSTQLTAVNPAPSMPANFSATGVQEAIILKWDAVGDEDLKTYKLYMSTSSSSFTPGPSNLVWTGRSTGVSWPSTLYGTTHYFKVAAVDIFDTPSTYAAANAGPTSSSGVDAVPPGTPGGFAVSVDYSSGNAALADFTATWTAVAASDLRGYQIRYRPGTTGAYSFVDVPAEATSTIIRADAGTSYEFQIQAIDFAGNRSAWSSTVTQSISNVAPSKPAAPTLVGAPQAFRVTHNLQKAAGGSLESDVAALEVYVGETNVWATANPQKVETIAIVPGSTFAVTSQMPYPLDPSTPIRYVYVKAVDTKGLASTNSDPTAVTITGLNGTYIADATISSAKIVSLEANKIVAGSGVITNLDIKSKLTVETGGAIESKIYTTSAGASGFRLTDTGLIIKTGSIAAAALEIQSSPNIMPAQYAGFEFVPSYYKLRAVTGAADSTATVSVLGSTTTGVTLSVSTSNPRYETQALSITNSSAASKTIYFGNSSSDYTIETQTGQIYIYSIWVYYAGSGSQSVTLGLSGAGGFSSTQSATVPANTWTRISNSVTIPAGTTKTVMSLVIPSASLTWLVDGAQVEEKIGALTTPSSWKPPSYTRIDGGSIRSGEFRSTTNITVNGVSQPAWSINFQGNAQFGDAVVRGKILVGLSGDPDAGQSRIQSGNYVAGSTGWAIDSSGFAEFRNLAVNSIKVTALDKPLQNTVATKLYDYMEAANLWRTVSGSVVGTTNDTGAYSASALLTMTGNSSVARDATGVAGGIAFEPEVLYRITARVRQLTGDNAISGVYKAKIGLYGYDDTGVLCGYDGTANANTQYMIVADGADLPIFDGASGQSSGWQTFVGYLKGRGALGTVGASPDQYNPGKVHENVRYIVPFVQLNVGNSTYVAQLDAFTIETFEAGAPNKIATDLSGRRSVAVETRDDEFLDHGIRFYSGEETEVSPGVIAQFLDNSNGNASCLIISPPSETKAVENYEEGNMLLRSRTANYLPNSTFASGITGWLGLTNGVVSWESSESGALGRNDDFALKVVPLAGSTATTTIGARYSINPQDFSEMIDQTDFMYSAWVNPSRDIPMLLRIVFTQTVDGVASTLATINSSATTALAGQWTRLSLRANLPDGLPETATNIEVQTFWNTAVATTDVLYIDDVQFEVGTVATDFKPATPSSLYVNSDLSQMRGALVVSTSEAYTIPAKNTALEQNLIGARAGAPGMPFIMFGNGLSNLVVGNFTYTDVAGKTRHFSEIGHLGRTIGRQGGGIRFYDESDEINPDRVEIFNKSNLPVLYTRDKNSDITKSGTTQDIVAPGFIFSDGNPPWKTLTKPSSFNNTTGGYAFGYYINNKRVYLRGMLDYNPGTGIPANTTLCTLPVEARPKKNVYGMGMCWSGSGAAPHSVLIFITTAGVVSNYGYATTGRYITFDSGFSFSIDEEETPYVPPGADVTPPSPPTAFSIVAYSSGTSTGTYTLKWTASNSTDVASTRIVWRTDRLPTHPTDGNVITVANSTSQVKSYNLGGLPVNKSISIRMWSIDKSGNFSSGYVNSQRYLLASPIVIYATSTGSWRDSFGGQWRTDTNDVYQGEYSGYDDNHRGLWFYGNQIADRMLTGGVTRTVTKVTIYLHRRNTSHGAAGDENINLYVHGYQTRPGGIPGLPVGQNNIVQLARNEAATVTMPSSWYPFIANGTRKGFAIYSSGGDYAVLDGISASSSTGKLTIYHKG